MSLQEYQNKINLLINDLQKIKEKCSKGELKIIILNNGLRNTQNNFNFSNWNKDLKELYGILRGQPTDWNNNIYNRIKRYYSQIDIELSIDETRAIRQILYLGHIHKDKIRQPNPKKLHTTDGCINYIGQDGGVPPHPYARRNGEDMIDWLIRCGENELYDYVSYVRKELNIVNSELIVNEEEHMKKLDKIEEDYKENERLKAEQREKIRKEQQEKKEMAEQLKKKQEENLRLEKEKQRLEAENKKKIEEEYTKELFQSSGYKYIYNHEYYIRGLKSYLNYVNDLRVSEGYLDMICSDYYSHVGNIDYKGNKIKGMNQLATIISFENEMKSHSSYNLERILKIEKDIILKHCKDEYYKSDLHILSKYETKTDELRRRHRLLYVNTKRPKNLRKPVDNILASNKLLAEFEAHIIARFITKYYSKEEAYNCFLKAYHYLKDFTPFYD